MSAYKLKKYVSPYNCGDAMGIRVRIECETNDPEDPTRKLSPAIFAYLPDLNGGHFNHVCNVIDLRICPVEQPTLGRWPKWYRLDYVDLIVPHVDMAYDFIQKVEEDVADLYRTMVRFNKIVSQTPTEVIIPPENASDFDPPVVTPSDSSEEENEQLKEEDNGNDGQAR